MIPNTKWYGMPAPILNFLPKPTVDAGEVVFKELQKSEWERFARAADYRLEKKLKDEALQREKDRELAKKTFEDGYRAGFAEADRNRENIRVPFIWF